MKLDLKSKFIEKWQIYFGNVELPITFFFTTESVQQSESSPKSNDWSCMLPKLNSVRRGRSISFSKESLRCDAASGYIGFSEIPSSVCDYLSTGAEKYKPSPVMVRSYIDQLEIVPPPEKYMMFKRWDMLEEEDEPEVVIFFAKPDVLSGLFYLAQFDEHEVNTVISPFSTGCASIITYPLSENRKKHPRSVMGMFEIESRTKFNENLLTFAIPMKKFEIIVDYMDETFLATENWQKIRKRINRKK